jgi:hypothetical protein
VYGLPYVLRSDNGAPFASVALGGLSALSKWWVDLGIRPERIQLGRPDQNGRHERMHRSLKAALGAPAWSLAAQQTRLDTFVHEYNWERSHEALQRRTPGTVYVPSQRPYPNRIPPPCYDDGVTVRQVRHNGEIKWRGRTLYLSEVLVDAAVSLQPCADGIWELHYRFHPLGWLDERTGRISSSHGWHSTLEV